MLRTCGLIVPTCKHTLQMVSGMPCGNRVYVAITRRFGVILACFHWREVSRWLLDAVRE